MLYETVSAIPGLFFNIYSFKHAKDQIKHYLFNNVNTINKPCFVSETLHSKNMR